MTIFNIPSPLGEVDLKTSFPLSRFGLNEPYVPIDFAVGGADDSSDVNDNLRGSQKTGLKILKYNIYLL